MIPTGTVTFLFTDIENSTTLWERQRERMQVAFARQEAIIRQAVAAHGGYAYKMIGDAFQVAFDTAPAAICAALEAQQRLQTEPWGETPIRVRMALHTGVTEERGDDYVGPALNRVGRLMSAGYGGQVLLTQATVELVQDDLPCGASLLDLGEHRFKDLIRSEHVYQLVAPDLHSEFPHLKSLNAFPNNLPVQLTSFIGRETEMIDIKLLLGVDQARLVTLTGSGGTGKTRLALQVATDLLETFKDGIWLAELAPLADPALVAQSVGTALGVREVLGKSIVTVLIEYLHPKHLLLILDNCEHIIEACAQLAGTLLQGCPNLHILATSREILGATGEVPYRVPSLATPDLKRLPSLETLTQFESVRLFVERTSQALPSFVLTPSNTQAVARICSRLDGIPLAIELAAARIRVLSVEQIAARLDDSFRLLTGGSRTVLPRHQTLRALIDWSYNLLSPAERTLFLRLSVFAGGWTMEAAEVVCADQEIDTPSPHSISSSLAPYDILDLMSQLVDKSLVLPVECQDGETRYRLLETIRQYAREKLLDVGGGEVVRGRHLDYFFTQAKKAEPNLRGRDQVAWLDRLEDDLDNQRLALEWALTTRVEVGLRLGTALLWFWHIRGHGNEGIDWLERLLEAEKGAVSASPAQPDITSQTTREGDRLVRAYALDVAGFLLFMQNKVRESEVLLKESLGIFQEAGQAGRRGVAMTLLHLGNLENDASSALERLQKSLAIFRDLGDIFYIAECLQSIHGAEFNLGNWKGARAAIDEDLALRIELGDQDGQATALNMLGNTTLIVGDHELAKRYFEQSLACYRAVNNIRFVSQAIFNLSRLAWVQGDYFQAAKRIEEAMVIGQELSDKNLIANAVSILAFVAWSAGDYDLAEQRARDTLKAGQEADNFGLIYSSLYILGKTLLSRGDYAQAAQHFNKLIEYGRNLGVDPVGVNYLLVGYALLACRQKKWERSGRLFAAGEQVSWWAVNTISPADRAERETALATLRAELGEPAFAAAWSEGQAMTLDQALAYATETS
jgi:predicted ATPase/class 3 adenylate cyclase